MNKENAVKLVDLFDEEIATILHNEGKRQIETIGLIASENVVSPLASCLEGSVFTIGKCNDCKCAVLVALLKQKETLLSMNLNDGGHLSHGASFHFSGINFNTVHYGVSKETEMIDLEEVRKLAIENNPKLIVCGASSYPRMIDYRGFRKIADEVGAYLWVDCAYDIGLVAGQAIPSPVPYADVVTFSTQKTLRGPRGCGVIMCKEELGKKIDRAVFPKIQGGPKGDMLGARAVLFKECMTPEFKAYAKQVTKNAKALAKGCEEEGLRLITKGTDTHMVILDVTEYIESGQTAEILLNELGLVTNKNMIPFDKLPPNTASGIRIGSPIMTTRGAKEDELYNIGRLIGKALKNNKNQEVLNEIKEEVRAISKKYPRYSSEWIPEVCREAFIEMQNY